MFFGMAEPTTSLRARELLARHIVPDLPDSAQLAEGARSWGGRGGGASSELFSGLLEAAFLVAAADGELAKEEVGELADLISQMAGEQITPGELSRAVAEFSAQLEKEGRMGRVQALAASVRGAQARREILSFAALVALCDHDLAPAELFVLHSLGKAFGLETADVNGAVRAVRAALDAPAG